MSAQKSVLITGCSDGGIGSALARKFQAEGLQVFATARNVSKMKALAELSSISLVPLDVTSKESVAAAVESVSAATNGKLNYLINNAASNQYSPALDVNIDEGKELFETNYWGTLQVIQGFAPLLVASKGTIVSVSSISAHANIPYCSTLAASKKSVEILMDTLRVELQPFGVSTLTIVNGVVRSNAQNHKHFENWKLPEDSYYKPLESHIYGRIQEKDGVYNDGVSRTATDEHASHLVGKILGGTTGSIWAGSQAAVMKFASTYLPTFIMDKLVVGGCGLEKLGGQASKSS